MTNEVRRPLVVEDVHKWFPIKAGMLSRTVGYVKAVDGASLTIAEGETMGNKDKGATKASKKVAQKSLKEKRADYGEQMLRVLSAEPALVNCHDGFAPRPADRPYTRFEKAGLAKGHEVVDLIFRRI